MREPAEPEFDGDQRDYFKMWDRARYRAATDPNHAESAAVKKRPECELCHDTGTVTVDLGQYTADLPCPDCELGDAQ